MYLLWFLNDNLHFQQEERTIKKEDFLMNLKSEPGGLMYDSTSQRISILPKYDIKNKEGKLIV